MITLCIRLFVATIALFMYYLELFTKWLQGEINELILKTIAFVIVKLGYGDKSKRYLNKTIKNIEGECDE